MTVAELCDLYLEEAAGRVKASTLAMDRSRIEGTSSRCSAGAPSRA